MISDRKPRRSEDGNSFDLSAKNPKFFKIVIQDALQEGRLAIPKKFVKEYGDCLSNRIILKLPDGSKWRMEVSKSGKNEAWLEKGWKEFAEHYSLKHGYLIIFEYHEIKSSFRVFIFDTTLLEIQYPSPPKMEQKKQTDDEILSCEKDKQEQHCPPSDSSQPSNASVKTEDEEVPGKLKESKGGKRGRKCRSESTTSRALEAANKLTLTNPSFIVVMKSNIYGRIPMMQALALGFIREHMECKSQQIILSVEDKVWAVTLNVYANHGRAAFSAGWPAFARENSLKDSHVCLFELVRRNMFQVHIFRDA